jgi:hypothetical protein
MHDELLMLTFTPLAWVDAHELLLSSTLSLHAYAPM